MSEAQDERFGDQEDVDAGDASRVRRVGVRGRPRARAGHVDERLASEREAEDMTADRELSDDDRLDMFRASRFQSVLPDLPTFPGYHVMWLTTTNHRDSLQNRLRMGYQLIRVSECPGWDGAVLKVGPVDNVVGVNEMVAAKIPLRLYNLYMREAHHAAPLQEEEKLRSKAEELSERAERMGARVEVGDGVAELARKVAPMRSLRE